MQHDFITCIAELQETRRKFNRAHYHVKILMFIQNSLTNDEYSVNFQITVT